MIKSMWENPSFGLELPLGWVWIDHWPLSLLFKSRLVIVLMHDIEPTSPNLIDNQGTAINCSPNQIIILGMT